MEWRERGEERKRERRKGEFEKDGRNWGGGRDTYRGRNGERGSEE